MQCSDGAAELGWCRMTGLLLHFSPAAGLSHESCVHNFVELCRRSSVLNANNQFDKNVWNLGRNQKGKNSEARIIFSTMEAAKRRARTPVLRSEFLPFAKAMLVYRQATRKVISQSVRIATLRYLEAALRLNGRDVRPTAVNAKILDAAVALARKSVCADVAYRVAGELAAIAELMRTKRFINLRKRWEHGLARPDELRSRISEAAIEARKKKLPSSAAIRAVGGVFQVAQGLVDTLIASSAALLNCAPERINEVVRLKRNCIVEGDGPFAGKVGIRWLGSKGAKNTTKWLPTAMKGVAQDAIKKLLECTKAGHRIASWYAANPKSIFLHEGAEYLRGRDRLTYKEVSILLWGNGDVKPHSAKQWCSKHGIRMLPRIGRTSFGYVLFADVKKVVLSMLPSTFPHLPGDSNIDVRDALYIIRKNELHPGRATYECMFDIVDQGDIAARLGQRDTSGIPSIFVKYGYSEDEGEPIHLRTHTPRHYLNMGAQMSGLSSSEIAIFSGRRDERQNAAYDHMSSDEVQKPVKIAIHEHGFMGSLANSAPRELINREEFLGFGLPAAHTTEYGYCVHNFASEPCQFHRDCINCEEQECVKGESVKEANLRALRAETEYLLGRAKLALAEEEFGADLWVTHQQLTLDRVNALLVQIDDPAVMVGARIRLERDAVPVIGHAVTDVAKTIGRFRTRALK